MRFDLSDEEWAVIEPLLPDAGVYYYKARIYSPTLGRFLQTDPIGYADGLNWYNYVGSDPINFTDPTGLNEEPNECDKDPKNCIVVTANKSQTLVGRFQYTGQTLLPDANLYYYKARIYSPTLGRFLQTDPIGYEDQYNLYAYVGNDPVNLVDPTGLQGCDVKRAGCSSERGEEGNGSRPDFINPDSITDPDSYWEGQIRQGDPLGETASQFGKPRSEMNFGAALSDGKLQDNLEEKHKSSEATFTASGGITIRVPVLNAKARKNLAADRKKIRLEIARAHQTALNEKRGWLTSQEIREYHEDVFEDNGLPRSTFGGSGLGYIVPDIVWCRRCPSS